MIHNDKNTPMGSFLFKDDTFITDDINFAKVQVDKINHSISAQKIKSLKPWEKSTNNNIYKSYGKSNYQLMKDLSKKFKILSEKNDNIGGDAKSIGLSNQKYYNRKEVKQIIDRYQIEKFIQKK